MAKCFRAALVRNNVLAFIIMVGILPWGTSRAFAVVGQAEKFDEFKEDELKEFHEALVREEKKDQQQEKAAAMEKELKEKQAEIEKKTGKEGKEVKEDIQKLRKELLGLPKRDRVHGGISGDYTYDSNINRTPPGHNAKSESTFNTNANVEFDLSGRKTDLRAEIAGGKTWNIKFPKSDLWTMEERLRYRRKYFKKVSHSINSRIARTSDRTVEIDDRRIRWDSNQQTSINYQMTRKLSLNGDASLTHRIFTQEAFDQDSGWQATFSPSAFWNFTPKSRVSLGYSLGTSKSRTKSGDSNSHEIHTGYFGKVTNKSSASIDIGFSHQTPKSRDGSTVNTITTGAGYIWQATPKTQATFQYIYSLQNSTSKTNAEAPSTSSSDSSTTGTDQTSRRTQYFFNNSWAISINSRLTKKISSTVTTSLSITQSKVGKNEDKGAETTEFTHPSTVALSYLINRWAKLRMAYTFSYRIGKKKSDTNLDHIFTVGLDVRV